MERWREGESRAQRKHPEVVYLGLKVSHDWFQNQYKLGWLASRGGYKRYSEGERGLAIAPSFLILALYRW